MYRDVKKKLLSVALCICMIIGAVQVVPKVKAAEQTVTGGSGGDTSKTYTVEINQTLTYNGSKQLPSRENIYIYEGGDVNKRVDPSEYTVALQTGDGTSAGKHKIVFERTKPNGYMFNGSVEYQINKAKITNIVVPTITSAIPWKAGGVAPEIATLDVVLSSTQIHTLYKNKDQFSIEPKEGVGSRVTSTVKILDKDNYDLDSADVVTSASISFPVAYALNALDGSGYSVEPVWPASNIYDGQDKGKDISFNIKKEGSSTCNNVTRLGFVKNYYLKDSNGVYNPVDTMERVGEYQVELSAGQSVVSIDEEPRGSFMGSVRFDFEVKALGLSDIQVYASGVATGEKLIYTESGSGITQLALPYKGSNQEVIPTSLRVVANGTDITTLCNINYPDKFGAGIARIEIEPRPESNVNCGKFTAYYTIQSGIIIQSLDFNGYTMTADNNVREYNGQVQVPDKVTVTDQAGNSLSASDYEWKCQYEDKYGNWNDSANPQSDDNFKSAGNKRVVVTGTAEYLKHLENSTQTFDYEISRKQMILTPDNSGEFSLVIDDGNCVYSGEAQQPTFILKYKGSPIPQDHYTVKWENNINAGSNATLIITGTDSGNFDGQISKTFTIKQLRLSSATIDTDQEEDSKPCITYNRNAVNPTFKIGTYKMQATDYRIVDYFDENGVKLDADNLPKNVGIYSVTIENQDKLNITGTTKNIPFKIVQEDIGNVGLALKVNPEGVEWNGGTIIPELKDTLLEEGTDYSLAYDNNNCVTPEISSGAAVIITGKGNYKGTLKLYFKILPRQMTNPALAATGSAVYNGGNYDIQLEIRDADCEGYLLDSSKDDYDITEVKYSEDETSWTALSPGVITGLTDAGLYRITVEGKGDYAGSRVIEVSCGTSLSKSCKVSVGSAYRALTYNGGALTPAAIKVVNTEKNNTAIPTDAYEVTYVRADGEDTLVDVGKVYVVATGDPSKGYYGSTAISDEAGCYYEITPAKWTVNGNKKYQVQINTHGGITYNPNGTFVPDATMGDITVQYNSDPSDPGGWKTLTYDTDYTVAWEGDPQTAGTKKIIITGKGNYEAVSINKDGFSYVVDRLDLTDPKIDVQFINPNLTYADGKPPIKVTYDNDYTLTQSVGTIYNDYTYTVSGGSILLNPDTGKYEATYVIRGYGNYTGVQIITKDIDKTSLSGIRFLEVSENPGEGQFYVVWNETELLIPDIKNPQQLKPENFSLKYNPVGGGNPVTLKKGTDYTVTSWGPNIEPGTKDGANHVTITGKGGYEGTTDIVCTLYLDINQTVIKGDLVSGSAVSATKFWDAYENNDLKSLVNLELETSNGVWETIPKDCYDVELDGTRINDYGPQTIKITGNKSGTYCFASIKRTTIETTGDLEAATVIINGGNPVQFQGVAVTGPGIVVQMGNTRLIEGTHYKIDQFINNETIGTATVVLEGLGLYRGTTKSQDFDIVCDLSNASIYMENEDHLMTDISSPGANFSYAYTNNGVKPQIQVYLPNRVMLTQASSYELAYTNEMSAGVAKVIITPLADSYLTGSQEISYTIRKTNIAPVTNGAISIDYDGEVTYTGNRITAEDGLNLKITDSNCTGEDHILKEGRDYDVTYQSNNHTNVTEKSYVIIRAKGGNYEGTYTFDFKIVPKNLNTGDITEVNPIMVYTGTPIEPDIKLHQTTGLERDLVLDQDFKITGYYDSTGTVRLLETPKEPGTYQAEVEGIKNYFSTRKISYEIQKKDLGSDIEIQFVNSDDEHCIIDGTGTLTCVYDGRVHVPGVKVKYRGMVLDPAEYTVNVYQKDAPGTPAIEAGIAVVEIQATENRFSGSATREFEIKPRDIADALIDYQGIENNQKFAFIDGVQAINPSVTVIDKGIIGTPTLVEVQDYDITYEDDNDDFNEHRYAGEVFMTFTGKGNYTGSKTYNFYIGEDISKAYTLVNGKNSLSTTYNGLMQAPAENDITVEKGSAAPDLIDPITGEKRYDIAYYKNGFAKANQVDRDEFVDAATYYIAVVGVPSKGTYAKSNESNSCVYTINPRSIAPSYILVSGYDGTYYYTGWPIEPKAITVEDTDLPVSSDVNDAQRRSVKLISGTDYELSYMNNISAGKASIIVTGKGNYTGNRAAYFNIVSSDASGNNTWDGTSEGTGSISNGSTTIAAADIVLGYDNSTYDCMMYNGYERIPTVNIAGISNNEFIITASNNIRPGVATLTITGRGNNFTGTIIKNFKIKADLSTYGTISTIADQVYTGYQITPHVTLTCGGNLLNQGSDYTVTYLNNTNVGRAIVMAAAASDSYYIGTATGSFNISNTAGGMEITGYASSYTYTGYSIAPDVVVTMNGRVLNRGTDYTVTYSNNTNVGTATMTVTGIGSFSGTKTINYTIEAKNIENCLTTAVTNYQYTGNTYTPNVTVTDSTNGKTLVAGTDYTITYSNNTNPGTASITVTALSKNYTGSKVIPFKIISAAVSGLRIGTIKNNSIKLSWSDQDYADGYQICNASNRVVATTSNNRYTVKGLTSCTTYKFKVRSYVENTDGSVSYGNFSTAVSAKTLLNTPTLTAKSTSAGKVTLTWTKVAKATGYEIYYSRQKDGIYKRLKTVSKSSGRKYVDSGLASGEQYYYTIRAYRTANGVKTYSKYNTIRSVKVK